MQEHNWHIRILQRADKAEKKVIFFAIKYGKTYDIAIWKKDSDIISESFFVSKIEFCIHRSQKNPP